MTAARRNIELKARCRDLTSAANAARSLGAVRQGVLMQTDTYFHVSRGRLKLREHEGGRAELIAYSRPDHPEFRSSEYHVVLVPNPAELKAALASALGVRGEVRKRRELYLWHNVRIHLDDVKGLGTFVEFEAVLTPGEDEAHSLRRLDELTRALRIQPGDRIAVSYSDLLGL
jgi:predicted adenylyl cyclase CyaB